MSSWRRAIALLATVPPMELAGWMLVGPAMWTIAAFVCLMGGPNG